MQHDDNPTPTCPSHPRRPAEPIWCPECRDRLATMLWRLPALHGRLLAAADGQATRAPLVRSGGSVHPPSPSPEFDQADEIEDTLSAWADAWLTHHGADQAHARRGSTTWAARILGDTRRGDVWAWWQADQLGIAVRRLTHAATRLLGGTGGVETIRVEAPCPSCRTHALTHPDGADTVTCGYCHRVMTGMEYAGWVWRLLNPEAVAS